MMRNTIQVATTSAVFPGHKGEILIVNLCPPKIIEHTKLSKENYTILSGYNKQFGTLNWCLL